jgi:hypothetical protein
MKLCVMQVCNGPQLCVCLKAVVTSPGVSVSTDSLDFGCIQCGECCILTVQLHNTQPVPCTWNAISQDTASTGKKKKKVFYIIFTLIHSLICILSVCITPLYIVTYACTNYRPIPENWRIYWNSV